VKIRENKRFFVLCFMAGFFAGILYANLVSGDYIASTGILDDYFLKQYAQTEIDTAEFLWYIAYLRLVPVMLLFALGCTKMRKGAASAYIVWTGFSAGMILVTAVMKMGVKGIILCLLCMVPQFICYIAAYLMLLWFLFGYPAVRWNTSKTMCFALFMLTGILLECYVNPVIVKMFLRTL
jgi:hypothetical protein